MSIEELPPPTPEEVAANLRTLLATCNVEPVSEDACVEIDYCIEYLLTLAQTAPAQRAPEHERGMGMSEILIPEDLREMYEKGGDPAHEPLSPYAYICGLIERIARAEAKVAALEAENGRLRAALTSLILAQDWDSLTRSSAAMKAASALAQQPSQAQDEEQP